MVLLHSTYMFKKISSTIFFVIILLNVNAQSRNYTVEGTFSGLDYPDKYVYLQYLNPSTWALETIDSTLVSNNKFQFSKTIESSEPVLAFITPDNIQEVAPVFFIAEEGVVNVTIEPQHGRIGGTSFNDEYQVFADSLLVKTDRLMLLTQEARSAGATDDIREKKREQFDAEISALNAVASDYITKQINNNIGEYSILTLKSILDPELVQELIIKSRPEFQENEYVQMIKMQYELEALRRVGGAYLDMKLKTPEGKEVSLSDYVGKSKYVLIDFWATWCRPCLSEIPTLKEAYANYKSKGFEIISISLDENIGAWKNFIKQRQMTWPQLSDMVGETSQTAQKYGVTSIPYTLLLDAEGKIVEMQLRGEALLEKLDQLLNN